MHWEVDFTFTEASAGVAFALCADLILNCKYLSVLNTVHAVVAVLHYVRPLFLFPVQ